MPALKCHLKIYLNPPKHQMSPPFSHFSRGLSNFQIFTKFVFTFDVQSAKSAQVYWRQELSFFESRPTFSRTWSSRGVEYFFVLLNFRHKKDFFSPIFNKLFVKSFKFEAKVVQCRYLIWWFASRLFCVAVFDWAHVYHRQLTQPWEKN